MRSVAPTVLVVTQFFVPGSKAGGPIRSLDALTESPDADYWVLTSDRDSGDPRPYPGIERNTWRSSSGRHVYYVNHRRWRDYLRALYSIRRNAPDCYYFNSMWNRYYTIIPLILIAVGIIPKKPVVLAPRGELLDAAFSSRPWRKRMGLRVIKLLARSNEVTFHATSSDEMNRIGELAPRSPKVLIPDLFKPLALLEPVERAPQAPLALIYLARIHPHKNLLGAISALRDLDSRPVTFDIFGSSNDEVYLRECIAAAESVPENVQVRFRGHLPHDEIWPSLRASDILFMPTKSENFGHTLREALAAGCLVLTSKTTPWTNLIAQTGIGTFDWADTQGFSGELTRLAEMNGQVLLNLRRISQQSYMEWERSQLSHIEAMAVLFRNAVQGAP